jgi:hypothetical protein
VVVLGSARASRARFGALAEMLYAALSEAEKVRDRGGARSPAREARALPRLHELKPKAAELLLVDDQVSLAMVSQANLMDSREETLTGGYLC